MPLTDTRLKLIFQNAKVRLDQFKTGIANGMVMNTESQLVSKLSCDILDQIKGIESTLNTIIDELK